MTTWEDKIITEKKGTWNIKEEYSNPLFYHMSKLILKERLSQIPYLCLLFIKEKLLFQKLAVLNHPMLMHKKEIT
jgi:hypothetical protein